MLQSLRNIFQAARETILIFKNSQFPGLRYSLIERWKDTTGKNSGKKLVHCVSKRARFQWWFLNYVAVNGMSDRVAENQLTRVIHIHCMIPWVKSLWSQPLVQISSQWISDKYPRKSSKSLLLDPFLTCSSRRVASEISMSLHKEMLGRIGNTIWCNESFNGPLTLLYDPGGRIETSGPIRIKEEVT